MTFRQNLPFLIFLSFPVRKGGFPRESFGKRFLPKGEKLAKTDGINDIYDTI